MNKRKDKILYHLWITKEEERILKELLEKEFQFPTTMLRKAKRRGDFNKA